MGFYGEVLDKVSDLITAAFGLVAALAWNGAIQTLFVEVFGTTESLAAQFTYAIIVTIIAVLATIWIARMAARAETEKKE
jgi:membrane protein implicated in regulation of membrane protease activity